MIDTRAAARFLGPTIGEGEHGATGTTQDGKLLVSHIHGGT
ncbi:hypothetical protein ACN6K9_001702 [Streptomyces sp. SAS_267]